MAVPAAVEQQQGIVRFYDLLPERRTFLEDVLLGLSRAQKTIPPKYFYDAAGSQLFERICELPEYYPTRTEMAIMNANIGEIAQFVGPAVQLMEFGSGAGVKTRLLIEHLKPLLYMPIEIDGDTMQAAAADLTKRFPLLNIAGITADYSRHLVLPEFVLPIRKKVAYFPGSSIGNFTPEEAYEFLRRARRMVGSGGLLVIGVDLKKDKPTLDAAYDDAAGVTAKFNLNLLTRINRELGADFQVPRWGHKAFYDEAQGRIEMHLVSRFAQFTRIAGQRFDFAPGETIHTEISCKYSVDEFAAMAKSSGFSCDHTWSDERGMFAVFGMMAI